MSSRRDQYKDAQKHGGDIDGSRRRQREAATSLRKDKRHAQLARKRMRDVLNLGGNIEKRDSVSDIDIPQLVKHMSQFNSTEECLNAVRQLRESTGVNQNIIDSLLQCEGAVDTLRQLLAVSNSSIQLEAIWCHVNISASKSLHTKAVLQNTPALIPFLENASEKHQDLSAWALGNIAGDSAEARDTIIAQGAHHPLIRMVTNHTLASTTVSPTATSIGEAAYFCLSNLCRGQGARPELFANDAVLASTLQILNVHIPVALAGSDPPLVQNPELARPMLLSPETITTRASVGIASEALWFLTYMTANNESLCERLCKDGLMSLLTSAMQATTEIATPMVSPALRTLGNILAGEDAFTELALQQANLFNGLGQCVTSPERSLRLEALWALSNIVAGKPEFATAVVDEGLFPYIVRIIEYDALQDPEMVTQAMYVINNTAHHGEAMCRFIYHKTDVLRQSLKVLRAGEGQSCKLVLQFLEMMLQSHAQVSWKVEEEGGVECLEMFEYHDNEELQRISSFLIDKYFYSNEEEPI